MARSAPVNVRQEVRYGEPSVYPTALVNVVYDDEIVLLINSLSITYLFEPLCAHSMSIRPPSGNGRYCLAKAHTRKKAGAAHADPAHRPINKNLFYFFYLLLVAVCGTRVMRRCWRMWRASLSTRGAAPRRRP